MGYEVSRELVARLRKPCGRTTGHGDSCSTGGLCGACADKAKAADHIETLERELAVAVATDHPDLGPLYSTRQDAARFAKLLQLCTEAKAKFGPKNEIRSVTMTFKTSVETGVGYRDRLRKLVDDMTPTAVADRNNQAA